MSRSDRKESSISIEQYSLSERSPGPCYMFVINVLESGRPYFES